jgi:chromosome partitioning protein
MKTIILSNQKGGVGKSTITCQFAHFLALEGRRVLIVDADHQGNSTKAIKASGKAAISATTADLLYTDKITSIEESEFLLVPSSKTLLTLEKQPDKHNTFATNIRTFLKSITDQFDFCIFDTNPSPDIRLMAALVSADFVLSPIQLNQEAVDGIGALIKDVHKVKSALNPNLELVGLLPNLVQGTPFQKRNFNQIATEYAKFLILLGDDSSRFALIPNRSALAEAQAAGKPIWELDKSAAREAWKEIHPAFIEILNRIEKKGDANNDNA